MEGKSAPKPIEMAVTPINQHQRNVQTRVLVLNFIAINPFDKRLGCMAEIFSIFGSNDNPPNGLLACMQIRQIIQVISVTKPVSALLQRDLSKRRRKTG